MSQIYDRVALIGLGLIASSMCWAMKRGGLAGEIVGYARSQETRDIARDLNLCDQVVEGVAAAVKDSIAANFKANGFSFGQKGSQLAVAFMLIRQDLVTTAGNSDYFGSGRDAGEILEEAHKRGVIKNDRFEDFEAGAIVIDILDLKTNKLIYRDFAKRDIDSSATPTQRKQRINAAVTAALAKFFR